MSSKVSNNVSPVVAQVCAEMGLDPFTANVVQEWVKMAPSTWPSCCMGGCDPCNDVLRNASRRVLAILEASGDMPSPSSEDK